MRTAGALTQLLGKVHPAHIPKPPAALYHYTTAAGLLGIVSSRHLRGTNSSFMNDSSEFTYGVELALKRFDAELKEHQERNDRIALMMGVLGEIWMKNQASLAETYVACFTEARDDLGQWRAYGGNADRYCVGVDIHTLSERGRYSFAPVIYSRQQQEKLIEDYFSATSSFLRQQHSVSEPLLVSCVKILCRWLLESIPFFKDDHFASEREWRAVTNIDTIQKGELHFDPSSGTLRPYVQMFESDLKLPITEVIVQSARRDERATKAVALLLSKYGYADTKVVESEVPFRAV